MRRDEEEWYDDKEGDYIEKDILSQQTPTSPKARFFRGEKNIRQDGAKVR